MNNTQKILNLLGIAKRAGKLITGEERVVEAIRKKTPSLVLYASDAGNSTKKKINDKSQYYQIFCTAFSTKIEIAQALGAPRTVIAVMDAGFGKKIKQLLKEI